MTARGATASSETPTTRDAILDAGERAFADRGFDGVSMREISAAAGLKNQASLYHHFRDKQALYEAVLERGIAPIVALVAASPPVGAGGETVDAVLDRMLDYLEARPHLPRLIHRAALDDTEQVRATLAQFLQPLYEQGLRVLGEGGRWEPADLPHVAAGIYQVIFGYFASDALLDVVTGQDPRSATAYARQRRFVKTAVAQLLGERPLARSFGTRPRDRRRRGT